MKKNNKRRVIISSLALIIVFVLAAWLYAPVIFQEGNPIPMLKGIIQLNFTRNKIVRLDMAGDIYLTKSKNGQESLVNLFDQGYEFIDQLGSGYFFKDKNDNILLATHRYYSRFYSIWNLTMTKNVRESIEWSDYKNKEYGFVLSYPSLSIDNKFWSNLPVGLDALLLNQVLSKNNNFYLHQKYDISIDLPTGKLIKTENTFIPEYNGQPGYGFPWHIVILDIKNESELGEFIKQKYGSGCNYESKQKTEFIDNYEIKIIGDGKDLGSTACPVNYEYYIRYSPTRQKVAFWHTGQECIIGLSFDNCFDQKISDSFHFIN